MKLARQAQRLAGKVINLYGPTECTINASWFDMDDFYPGTGVRADGRPVANLQFMNVLDRAAACAGGRGGRTAYCRRGLEPGLFASARAAAQRFIDNPFNTGGSPKMYRTGDLVR